MLHNGCHRKLNEEKTTDKQTTKSMESKQLPKEKATVNRSKQQCADSFTDFG